MILTSTGDSGHYSFRTGHTYFWMRNADATVRCAVSKYALDRLEDVLFLAMENRMQAFHIHRQIIEEIAANKYEAGIFDKDGKTILVDELDILLSQAANDLGSSTEFATPAVAAA
jgi:uncharacterized protein DUF1488